jgi:hypothetical protein
MAYLHEEGVGIQGEVGQRAILLQLGQEPQFAHTPGEGGPR